MNWAIVERTAFRGAILPSRKNAQPEECPGDRRVDVRARALGPGRVDDRGGDHHHQSAQRDAAEHERIDRTMHRRFRVIEPRREQPGADVNANRPKDSIRYSGQWRLSELNTIGDIGLMTDRANIKR